MLLSMVTIIFVNTHCAVTMKDGSCAAWNQSQEAKLWHEPPRMAAPIGDEGRRISEVPRRPSPKTSSLDMSGTPSVTLHCMHPCVREKGIPMELGVGVAEGADRHRDEAEHGQSQRREQCFCPS